MEKEGIKSVKRNCEICTTVEAKYKCPRCSIRTCSILCVKRHKRENDCDGKRNIAEFVSIKDFNENNLISDYRFLESASQCASNAARDGKFKMKYQRNKHVNAFLSRARSKGIHLLLMPKGMSKRKENTSRFDYREKCLLWRVKLNFTNENAEYVIPRVNGKITVKDILKSYIHPEESDPIIRFRLKDYVDAWFDNIRIYLKKEKSRDQGYDLVDGTQPLENCLRHKVVVEFPTFYISIHGKDSQYIQASQTRASLTNSQFKQDSQNPRHSLPTNFTT